MANWDFEHRPTIKEAIQKVSAQWAHDHNSTGHDPSKWGVYEARFSWRNGIHNGRDSGYISVWFVAFRESHVDNQGDVCWRDFVKFCTPKKKECTAWLESKNPESKEVTV